MTTKTGTARDVPCPTCGVRAGIACTGTVRNSHVARLAAWARAKSREAGRARAARLKASSIERAVKDALCRAGVHFDTAKDARMAEECVRWAIERERGKKS